MIRSHILRNALLPIVTMLGMDIGVALGGAIFTETVFSLPGLGQTALNAIANFDLPTVQGIVVFATLSIVAFNLVVDLSVHAVVDPRIRLSDGGVSEPRARDLARTADGRARRGRPACIARAVTGNRSGFASGTTASRWRAGSSSCSSCWSRSSAARSRRICSATARTTSSSVA